jgi:hypothetical protein
MSQVGCLLAVASSANISRPRPCAFAAAALSARERCTKAAISEAAFGRGEIPRVYSASTSFQAQAAHFLFSADSGDIAASHRRQHRQAAGAIAQATGVKERRGTSRQPEKITSHRLFIGLLVSHY